MKGIFLYKLAVQMIESIFVYFGLFISVTVYSYGGHTSTPYSKAREIGYYLEFSYFLHVIITYASEADSHNCSCSHFEILIGFTFVEI